MTDQTALQWLEEISTRKFDGFAWTFTVHRCEVVGGELCAEVSRSSDYWPEDHTAALGERLDNLRIEGLDSGCQSCGYGATWEIRGTVRS